MSPLLSFFSDRPMQALNRRAIDCLESLGMDAPTQAQIDTVEAHLYAVFMQKALDVEANARHIHGLVKAHSALEAAHQDEGGPHHAA